MAKVNNISEEINLLKNQIADLEEKFKRALADYQNQEKRFLNQRLQIIKTANESLLDKLLPILDDLERAQTHLKDAGLGYVLAQLEAILKSEGLETIDPINQAFDPLSMDCAEVVPGPANIVVRTVLKGFKYGDKILRPAKVEVGQGDNQPQPSNISN